MREASRDNGSCGGARAARHGRVGDVGVGYATAWRRAFASRIRLAAVYAHIAMNPALHRAVLPMLKRWPALISAGARWGGKARCAVDAHRFPVAEASQSNS